MVNIFMKIQLSLFFHFLLSIPDKIVQKIILRDDCSHWDCHINSIEMNYLKGIFFCAYNLCGSGYRSPPHNVFHSTSSVISHLKSKYSGLRQRLETEYHFYTFFLFFENFIRVCTIFLLCLDTSVSSFQL